MTTKVVLFVCLLAAAASAQLEIGSWNRNIDYRYRVESRALTALHDIADQYAGIILQAELLIQPHDSNRLIARIEHPQYTEVHAVLPHGWESHIPESQLQWRPYQMTPKPFEIRMKNGAIHEVLVEKDTPVWDVNVIKSFLSQLQVDLNGANLMSSHYNQQPEHDNNAEYKTMEDTVTGKCETLYNVHPLAPHQLFANPEMVPLSHLKQEGEFIAVVKSKNYSNCEQYNQYSVGLDKLKWWNKNNDILSQSSISEIVISGSLSRHIIHSAVTKNVIIVNPVSYNTLKGQVVSKVNVTLMAYDERKMELEQPSNPQSVGNLVYGTHADNQKKTYANSDELNIDSSEERFLPNHVRGIRHRRAADKWGRQTSDSSSSSQSASDEMKFPVEQDYLTVPVKQVLSELIGKNKQVDRVAIAQKIIDQIVRDRLNPSELPKEQTLLKFVELNDIVSEMSAVELNKLTHRYQYNKLQNLDSDEHVQAWKVYRDAVVQAGTGPALRTIKEWIQTKKVQGVEAAQIISDLTRTAVEITVPYMKEFWSLIELPEVQSQPIVYHYAIMSYCSLTRNVLFSRENSKSHFLHKFGREQVDDLKRFTFETLIPYLETRLHKAIEGDEKRDAQVYIRALGNVAHPKILAVFAPYLEGKKPATEFQRFIMVSFLEKLATRYPVEAQSVLLKIIHNTGDAHHVRCAAVYNLMRTQPSADLLARIAYLTKNEPSIEVRSTIKTIIESLAQFEHPKTVRFVEDVKKAAKLLEPEVYPTDYSSAYFMSLFDDELNYGYDADVAYHFGHDNAIPKYYNFNLRGIFGEETQEFISIGAMVSSVLDASKIFDEETFDNYHSDTWMNKIEKLLNIKYDTPKDLEGNLFVRLFGLDNFISFDNHTIERMMQDAVNMIQSASQPKPFSLTKMYERETKIVAIPLESGLPFFYSLRTPTILSVTGHVQVNTVPEMNAQDEQTIRVPEIVKIAGEFRGLVATTLAVEIGFTLPREATSYLSGYNQQLQLNVPVRVNAEVNTKTEKVTLELEPLYTKENNKIAEYNTWPYTAKVNMLEYKPAVLSSNKLTIHAGEQRAFETMLGQRETGMAVQLKHTTEDKYNKWSLLRIIDQIRRGNFLALTTDQLLKSKTVLEYVGEENRKVSFAMDLDRMAYYDEQYKQSNKKQYETQEHVLSDAHNVEQLKQMETIADETARKQHLVNEVIKGIRNPKFTVLDVTMRIDGGRKQSQQFIATLAFSLNETMETGRMALYAARQLKAGVQHMFVSAEQKQPQPIVMSFVDALKLKPTMKTKVYVTYVNEDSTPSHLHLFVNEKQSDEHRQQLRESDYSKLCAQQMDQGKHILPACINATYRAQLMDLIDIEVAWDKTVGKYQFSDVARSLYHFIANYFHPYVTSMTREQKTQDKLMIQLRFLPNSFDTVNVTRKTPSGQVYYEDIPVPQWLHPVIVSNGRYFFYERAAMAMLKRHHVKSIAVLDTNTCTTFNNRTFNVHLGNCYHLFAQANLQRLSQSDRLGLKAINVLVRDTAQNKRDVKIIIANEQGRETIIDIESNEQTAYTAINPVAIVKINGQAKTLALHEPIYVEVNGDDCEKSVAEIYVLQNGFIYVNVAGLIETEFDGKRVKLAVDDVVKGQIRGFAGPFSNEPFVDYIAPKNCLLKDARDFVASYALVDDTCQGPAREYNARALKAKCVQRKTMFVKYVNARESRTEQKHIEGCLRQQTRYIVDDEEQVCFTMRPMPRCSKRCQPLGELVAKRVNVYCLPKSGPVALYMKQIDNGASPDFSTKSVTKTLEIRVPTACH